MSKRSPLVDFGPVALPVNAFQDSWGSMDSSGPARHEDALRLQRLMQEKGGHDTNCGDIDDVLRGRIEDRSGFSPRSGQSLSSVVSCLALASSVAVATANMATRIELNLSPEMLPRSRLSVEKTSDGFRFDLYVSDHCTVAELSRDLAAIAAEVGKQLQQPLELRLYAGTFAAPVREAAWRLGGVA